MKYGVYTCIFALFLFVLTLSQMITPAFAEEPTITLEGSRPKGGNLSWHEPAPPDMIIPNIHMNFETQNPAEFKQLLEDQQNSASPNFNKEYTPQELHARFGESESQFNEVKNWLLQQHFVIVDETYGRASDFIAFSGTIAQIEAAFHVRIVWDNATGRYADVDAPQIPARFDGLIRGLVGIYNTGGGQMLLQRSGQST